MKPLRRSKTTKSPQGGDTALAEPGRRVAAVGRWLCASTAVLRPGWWAGLADGARHALQRVQAQGFTAPEPIAGAFRAKQRRSAMQSLPVSAVGLATCSTTVVGTYWTRENHAALLLWMLVLSSLQLWGMRARSFFLARETASKRSLRLMTYHASMIAGIWSLAPLALLGRGSPAQEMVLLSVSIGLASAGSFSLVMVPMAATAWLLITTLTMAFSFAWHHPDSALATAWLASFYVTFAASIIAMTMRIFGTQVMAEAETARQHKLVQLLLSDFEENSSDMLWQTDADGMLLQPSARFAAAFDVSMEALASTTLHGLLEQQQRLQSQQLPADRAGGNGHPWLERLAAGEPFRDLLVPLGANGDQRWWSVTAKPLFGEDGSRTGWRGVATDVTSVQRKNDDLRFFAERDPLTGLTNRREFHEHLALLMSKVSQASGVTLVCIDLDHFKKINDTEGHIIGDRLLRETARRLLSLTRPKDTVARLGSDEFALLLPGLDSAPAAESFVARLQDGLHQACEIDGVRLPLRVSIGMAIAPRDGADVDQLLSNADLALYAAKRGGRGTYRLFGPDMGAHSRRRQLLERDLAEAITNGELRVVFQPQVCYRNGEVTGFEALVRWRHSTLGEITPLEFIPIAEETGFIVDLGAWVLGVACRHAQHLAGEVLVSVNVSAVQIMSGGFPAVVARALADSGLPSHQLELEITESVFVDDSERTVGVLQALHALGVRIALDDFGTGYSSLAYLRRFPFDTLKIDKAFVQELLTSGDARAIVETIISLAQTLKMDTVAEGVEEQAQADVLGAFGCDLIQGYLMSRPLPADDVANFLSTWSAGTALSAQRHGRAARLTSHAAA